MNILIVFTILLCAVFMYCMTAAASKMSRMEERWFHPPDDDDGISILEEETDAKKEGRDHSRSFFSGSGS